MPKDLSEFKRCDIQNVMIIKEFFLDPNCDQKVHLLRYS